MYYQSQMVVYVYALNYAVSETGVAVVLLSFHINSDFFFLLFMFFSFCRFWTITSW